MWLFGLLFLDGEQNSSFGELNAIEELNLSPEEVESYNSEVEEIQFLRNEIAATMNVTEKTDVEVLDHSIRQKWKSFAEQDLIQTESQSVVVKILDFYKPKSN